jgi:hypothetical protein
VKKFEVVFAALQNIPRREFTGKFFVEIEKANGSVKLAAYPK